MAGVKDEPFLAFVRTQACLLAAWGGCDGATEPSHSGRDKGTGIKADDTTAVPLCHQHHIYDWHQLARRINGAPGYFARLTADERRAWALEAVALTRERYAQSLWDAAQPVPF